MHIIYVKLGQSSEVDNEVKLMMKRAHEWVVHIQCRTILILSDNT